MKRVTRVLFVVLVKLGGPGLLVFGILDSSFLFAPLGNDLLVVALAARAHRIAASLYYAGMSAAGSVLGCLLVDTILRPAGEKGLEKHLPPRRLEYVRKKVARDGTWALILASITPPPFPFTPFIMAAAALQYPRGRMLSVVGAARLARFATLSVFACFFGARILKWADQEIVQVFLVALTVVCIAGSAISVYGWIKRSRVPERAPSLVPQARG